MSKVRPFGVVVEVTINETTYYCMLVNDFDRFKTFGNYDLDSRPFVVMDVQMNSLSEENVELYDQMEEIIDRMVIREERDEDEDEE